MTVKSIALFSFFILGFICCKNSNNTVNENEALTPSADSLSIKLNSPALKAVNAQLLKNPNDAALYNNRAIIYIDLKQQEAAIADAKRAVGLDSTKAEYYITIVDALFSLNKTRNAKDILERIEKKFPTNTEALLKLSELYYLVKQYQKAIDYTNKALKIDENLAKAYYLKGLRYL